MTKDEIERLQEPLFALGAAFNTEMSKPRVTAYLLAVEDLRFEKVIQAIKRAIREGGKHCPTPAEIRQMTGVPSRPYHQEWKGFGWEQLPAKPDWPQLTEASKPHWTETDKDEEG